MKRRSASNQQSAGVSLFPFLAVLLCTMGALIVVLVVIARHARMQVAAEAKRALEEAGNSEIATQREELEWRIGELTKSRDETKKLLSEKQLELSHIEEHARRIRDKLDELAAAKEHFNEMAAGDAKENDELKSRLGRLRMDADRTKAEIDKLRGKGGPGGESYAIIPYHGPNETRRRPIYVECRGNSVILQPEGIVLTPEDFSVDLGPSNPLVSALRAASDYHKRNQFAGRGDNGTPYPLFIIRPDGTEMSNMARAAIVSWGPEFGYELVGQDWPLEYPPPDPMLTLAMRQAVSEGRMRQAYLARAAPMLSRAGTHATFRASSHGGIVQVDGGGGGPRRGQMRPRGMSGRRGGMGGGGGQTGGDGSGGLGDVGSNAASGEGPVHSIDGSDNPYLDALAATSAPEGPGSGGTGLYDGSGGNGQPGGPHGSGTRNGGSMSGGGGPWPAGSNGRGTSQGGMGLNGSGLAVGGGAGSGNQPRQGSAPGNAVASGNRSGSGSGTGTGTGDSLADGNGAGTGNKTGGGKLPGGGWGSAGNLSGNGYPPGSTTGYGNGLPGGPAMAGGAGGNKTTSGNGFGGTGNGLAMASPGQGQGNASGDQRYTTGGGNVNGQTGVGPSGAGTGTAAAGSATAGGYATGANNLASAQGTPGGPALGMPRNTGATAPGGPYRTAAATGTGTSSSSGPGNSELTGNSSNASGLDDLNVPASANGYAGASVVNSAGATSAGGAAMRSGSAGGNSGSGSSSPTVLSESSGSGGSGGPSGGNSASGSRKRTSGQMANSGSAGTSSGTGSQSSSSSSSSVGGMGGSSSAMMQSQQMGGLPSPNLNFGKQNQQSQESLAKKRDKNWANPDASTPSIPIQRPIRIVCDAEHLTLLPEGRGRQGMRVIPFKRQTIQAVDDLVSTVWDRIDSWGTAGKGMYWRPVLMMEVEPGGQRRYAELQALLADSGFDVHGMPRRRVIFPAPRNAGPVRKK